MIQYNPRSWGVFARVVIIGVLVLALMIWAYTSGIWQRIITVIRASGAYGLLISYLLVVVQTVVPFAPFAVLAGLNTSVHGFWAGYLSTWAGAFTGSLLLYYLSQRVMSAYFEKKLVHLLRNHSQLQSLTQRIRESSGISAFVVILLLRLQPWLPSSVIDISSGLSRIRWAPYLAATVFGQGSMVALASYIGHQLLHPPIDRHVWWLVVGISALILIVYVGARFLLARSKKFPRSH